MEATFKSAVVAASGGVAISTRLLAFALVFFFLLPRSSVAAAGSESSPPNPALIGAGTTRQRPALSLLAVVINQQDLHEVDIFLNRRSGNESLLYASAEDISHWRLHKPAGAGYAYEGKTYYALNDIPGLSYHVDKPTQTLYIKVSAATFEGTIVDGFSSRSLEPDPTPWGGFANYDVLGNRVDGTASLSGLFETGLFNDWGVGVSNFLYRHPGHGDDQLVRLDTAWRYDSPGQLTTLVLGDAITRGGQTALSVRMGGISYGTNFSTRPYLVTFPMPGLNGSAAVPSTVDLYVNGLLKGSTKVPAGPFSIPTVPVVTGPGTARLVVRDALGRQRVISTSFYANSSLLKPHLNDYSVSIGALRKNYAVNSADYSGFVATGLFRHGFTDDFTGETYGEATEHLRDLSFGATFASVYTGSVSAAVAASDSRLGQGIMGHFGINRQWEHFNVNIEVRLASRNFTELGYDGLPAPRQQLAFSAGTALGGAGSVYASYLDQSSPIYGRTRLVTGGYGVNVIHGGFLSINAFHSLSGEHSNGVTLSFNLPLGGHRNFSAGVSRQNHEARGYLQLQRSLPAGTGYGYRLATEVGHDAVSQAEFDYQNRVGTYRVGVTRFSGQNQIAAEASGGLAFIGGGIHASRRIDDAFGLVEVPGLAGIPVYSNNHEVATTDSRGQALVPRLQPYQQNRLHIGLKNLPLDAQVDTLDANAVPRYRSGVIIRFPVTRTRGATFTVRLDDGSYLPAGALVRIKGKKQTFPVGLKGKVYVTGLADHNILEATWNHRQCTLEIDWPKTHDPLPDLGSFACHGVRR